MKLDFKKEIVIPLGKIVYKPYVKTRCCLVTVEVGLYSGYNSHRKAGDEYFAITAVFWNKRRTDIYCSAQCFEEVEKYFGNGIPTEFHEPYKKLMALYEKYRLRLTNTIPQEDLDTIKNLVTELAEISEKLKI